MPRAPHNGLHPPRCIDHRRNSPVNHPSQSIRHTSSFRRCHPRLPTHPDIPTGKRSNQRRSSGPKPRQTELHPTAHCNHPTSITLRAHSLSAVTPHPLRLTAHRLRVSLSPRQPTTLRNIINRINCRLQLLSAPNPYSLSSPLIPQPRTHTPAERTLPPRPNIHIRPNNFPHRQHKGRFRVHREAPLPLSTTSQHLPPHALSPPVVTHSRIERRARGSTKMARCTCRRLRFPAPRGMIIGRLIILLDVRPS
jgi:hypothetical protein